MTARSPDSEVARLLPEVRETYEGWKVRVRPEDVKGCGFLILKTEQDARQVAAMYGANGYKAARDLAAALTENRGFCG